VEKDFRTYSNAKGEGKLFNMVVCDASGEVRITGFQETFDAYYEKLCVGRCYLISGGSLKPKHPTYNTTSHQFEITLNRSSSIVETDEPQGADSIPRYSYDFSLIADLENAPDDSKVDVLAVVMDCTDATVFTARSGKELTKRVMQIADMSGKSIECTIFGQPTQNITTGDVIAIKAAKVWPAYTRAGCSVSIACSTYTYPLRIFPGWFMEWQVPHSVGRFKYSGSS
jgi:replication factor A1